jgi:SAM-dependent methyltransferase
MYATELEFEDESFDLVFSYNSFEHFADPGRALREAARVTRIGGCVFLKFGPIYMSPRGLHVVERLGVPYCQHLFCAALLDDFMRERGLAPPRPDELNRWTLARYRELWRSFAGPARGPGRSHREQRRKTRGPEAPGGPVGPQGPRATETPPPLRMLFYREERDLSGLPVIERFPSCLRSKARDFDEFLVGEITVLFRRTR